VVVETAPVASSTSEPAVLKTVQDEILNLAIRLEESEKLSREVKTLSEILTDTTQAIARIEAGLGDTNVALTMQEQKQSESCRDQQFLSGELSDIQTEMQAQSRRIEEYAQSLTQTVNARLGEIQNMLMDSVLVAVQQEIKSVLAQTPSPSGSIEDTLRTLKALGAEVTIHIPR
jgi:chromosome segregation ATPase